jgi:hypothetical protein
MAWVTDEQLIKDFINHCKRQDKTQKTPQLFYNKIPSRK